MGNISRVMLFFTKILSLWLILAMGSVAHSSYLQLQTKEQQIKALEDVIHAIEFQYGDMPFGFDPVKKFEEYKQYILKAHTLDEAKGLVPKPEVDRDALSQRQARDLFIGLISELHDGHISVTHYSGDATVLGIRTVALHGKLLVAGVNEKLLKPVGEAKEILPNDEIIEVDGKPVDFYKRRNLNYVSNGTIEARKDEALERILEVPHALIPAFSKNEVAQVKFRRGNEEFVNSYKWTLIDAIRLTRPINPSDAVRREEMYLTDQEFVFGAKGAVRSAFMEGLRNLVADQDQDQEKQTIQVQDFGAEMNFAISNEFLNTAKAISDSAFNKELQRPLTRQESAKIVGQLAQVTPVDRIKVYVIHEVDKDPVASIRIPSYSPPGGIGEVLAEINYIAAAISMLKENGVKKLIIDQGTNPGGYVAYVHMLLKLFATPEKPVIGQKIQYLLNEALFSSYLHTEGLDEQLYGEKQDPKQRRAFLEFIRKQMDEGMKYSSSLPFNLDTNLSTEDTYGIIKHKEGMPYWNDTLAVIIDSRSASGSEFFPAHIQDNARGMIIGEKTMGLGNPVVGHINSLGRAEMNFRCPFAKCERFNSVLKHIEGIGVPPDVHRTIRIEDLKEGLKSYARDILDAVHRRSDNKSYEEIQIALNEGNTIRRAKNIIQADGRLADKGISRVVGQFISDVNQLDEPIEENVNPWLAAYTKLFDTLDELEEAKEVPHEAWDLIAIPLPLELVNSDDVLMTSTRKDVVLRRFEELLESGALNDRPNMKELVKNLFKNAYRIKGFFHFGEPCELLFQVKTR